MEVHLTGLLLVLCTAACVSASYNGTCARELVWAPRRGKATETLEVGWPDGVPAFLVLGNATSDHYLRITGRYNKAKAAPGLVSEETHECFPLGTNKTLMLPNADASARIRQDPVTNDTLLEPLPGEFVFLLFFTRRFLFKRKKVLTKEKEERQKKKETRKKETS
jgi:hypothetical protein